MSPRKDFFEPRQTEFTKAKAARMTTPHPAPSDAAPSCAHGIDLRMGCSQCWADADPDRPQSGEPDARARDEAKSEAALWKAHDEINAREPDAPAEVGELIERLRNLSALEPGWYANVGRKTGEKCCAAMTEAAAAIAALSRKVEVLTEALRRQTDNMAFILNRVDLHKLHDKFEQAMTEDRQALSAQKDTD